MGRMNIQQVAPPCNNDQPYAVKEYIIVTLNFSSGEVAILVE